ncbi:FecR family protein [Dyadobacter helix]|uniref:FecR family protein n=1 Tax=Dyadobacter helix TaxID=2822344 RepID=UPI001BFC52BC|nr:FecR family protein [Dyadobacter sp. CECT 9275]
MENLVQRYRNNDISDTELEVFFYLLKQGKLDQVLDTQLEADKDDIINGNLSEKPESRFFSRSGRGLFLIVGIFLVVSTGWLLYTYRVHAYHFIFGDNIARLTTAKGQRIWLKFGDGSVVYLNEGSTLLYPEDPVGKQINVELLEGEAYFDIANREVSNFFVLTKGIRARLPAGSALDIRAYKYLRMTEFSVVRGQASLVNDSSFDMLGIELSANERATVDMDSGKFTKTNIVGTNAIAWKEGILVFDQERFATVAATLESRFDVKIAFESESIKETKLSGKFLLSDPLADILDTLARTHHLHYMLDQNTVILKSKE